jgi:hypothetical protein
MSIIHDALHKTQKTLGENNPTGLAQQVPLHKDKRKLYAIYALAICVGVLFAHLLFSMLGGGKKPAALPAKSFTTLPISQTTPPAPVPAIPTVTAVTPEKEGLFSRKKPEDSLVLNGVFFSEDQGYALINNRILKKGDTIEDARITDIQAEEVELEIKGKKLKLSTTR